jgi:hypothetical protein
MPVLFARVNGKARPELSRSLSPSRAFFPQSARARRMRGCWRGILGVLYIDSGPLKALLIIYRSTHRESKMRLLAIATSLFTMAAAGRPCRNITFVPAFFPCLEHDLTDTFTASTNPSWPSTPPPKTTAWASPSSSSPAAATHTSPSSAKAPTRPPTSTPAATTPGC